MQVFSKKKYMMLSNNIFVMLKEIVSLLQVDNRLSRVV